MRTKLAWFVGLVSAANGTFMLVLPVVWYPLIPGVLETGPFNAHFIRDIGAAFLVSGAALVWFANDSRAWPAALAAAAFLSLHALVHVHDVLTARESLYHAAHDIPDVYLFAVLACWIAWPRADFANGGADLANGGLYSDQMAVAPADRRVRKGL
jgi:hypothetical protein